MGRKLICYRGILWLPRALVRSAVVSERFTLLMLLRRINTAHFIRKFARRFVPTMLDYCSMSHGTVFQLIWNRVPDKMEWGYTSHVTRASFILSLSSA